MMSVGQIFLKILNMGYMASFVILAVLLIRGLFLRRFPKKYAYWMWLIVGIRLVCPLEVSSPLSLFNLQVLSEHVPAAIGQTEAAGQPAETGQQERKAGKEIGQVGKQPAAGQMDSRKGNIVQKVREEERTGGTTTLQIAAVIWASGIAALLLWNLILTLCMKRRLRKAVWYVGHVYECEEIASPFVMGLLRPRIYIPFRLEQKEREYVLRHERCHIRRRDYIVKLIAFFITIVYWFHPLVWIAYFCMVRDMEMSCDECVLAEMGTDIRRDYSMSLLSFALNRRQPSMNLLAFGETNTRKRVKNIMNFKKQGKWIGLIAVILLIVAGVVCLTNAEKSKDSADGAKDREAAGQETVLAKVTVNGYELRLVAKEAEKVEEASSPYQGMYAGSFVLRSYADNQKTSELPLTFDSAEQSLYFPDKLSLNLVDYDGDGRTDDFTLGQKTESSAMTYQFYTVNENTGSVDMHELTSDDRHSIMAEAGEYSQVFQRSGREIQYTAYLPENGKTEKKGVYIVVAGEMKPVGE